ncbi:MAG: glutaredoxin domain-containing protein [Candidatus Nanopelagicales bacterium]
MRVNPSEASAGQTVMAVEPTHQDAPGDAGGETGARRRPAVALYTLSGCGHCDRARELLRRRAVAFTEIRGDGRPHFRRELRELTGRSTAPQILVDGEGIGGASDLSRLDRRGVLGPLLQGADFPHAVVRRRLSPVGLLSAVVGGGCGPWRFAVALVERDGTVSRRLPAPEAMAHELASAFNSGDEPVSSAMDDPPDHPTRAGG